MALRLTTALHLQKNHPHLEIVSGGSPMSSTDYVEALRHAKMFVSPFGFGEFSGKDYESVGASTALLQESLTPLALHCALEETETQRRIALLCRRLRAAYWLSRWRESWRHTPIYMRCGGLAVDGRVLVHSCCAPGAAR